MKFFPFLFGLFISLTSFGQKSRLSNQEISLNFFRNPSIGLEYRYKHVSFHAGYYLTNFESNTTWKFIKTGTSIWFLPTPNGSSFYTQISYMRGLNRNYKNLNAGSIDLGFRWVIWKGFQTRLGVTALFESHRSIKINPTPSINYSFFF